MSRLPTVCLGWPPMLKKLLDSPSVYRIWQAPFVMQKLKPVTDSLVGVELRSVLDLGCGPGTNSRVFRDVDHYVGLDISERYITYARRHHSGEFLVGDVTQRRAVDDTFDLILLNSLMHHLDDAEVDRLVRSLPQMLESTGEIQIVDLVMADQGLPRVLAKADRGRHARTVADWVSLLSDHLDVSECKEFSVGLGPLQMWNLVHIRAVGKAC